MSDPVEWRRGEYVVSTDASKIDGGVVWGYLTRSYWAEGIPREIVERAIGNSLNFGLYRDAEQIGFARIVSDYATFAYVADVFVLEAYRGQKLAVWLMECVAAHPSLQGLRRWMLGTKDAHSLYEKTGFVATAAPDRWMEKADPGIYKRARSD